MYRACMVLACPWLVLLASAHIQGAQLCDHSLHLTVIILNNVEVMTLLFATILMLVGYGMLSQLVSPTKSRQYQG